MSISNAAHCSMMHKAGGVQLVNYVSTDGNAWIDTDYVPLTRQSFVIDFAATTFSRSVFFGVVSSHDQGQLANNSFCYMGMMNADRRVCLKVMPDGSDWLYWNSVKNDGNQFWDGLIHRFSCPLHSIRSPFDITVDDNTTIPVGAYGYKGATTTTSSSIAIFGEKSQDDGTVVGIPPISTGFKLRRLAFYDSQNVCTAEFFAAKRGNKYGIFNTVSGAFFEGVGGVITGA